MALLLVSDSAIFTDSSVIEFPPSKALVAGVRGLIGDGTVPSRRRAPASLVISRSPAVCAPLAPPSLLTTTQTGPWTETAGGFFLQRLEPPIHRTLLQGIDKHVAAQREHSVASRA
jgi:hypothetical protein